MLTIYPTEDYDSFVSVLDADTFITNYSPFTEQWNALTEVQKEMYLRIATDRIFDAIDTDTLTDYDATTSCLPKACALMAVKDVVFTISSGVNENTGLVSKEKVGDIEQQYSHGYTARQVKALDKDPYPKDIKRCLSDNYGATFNVGIKQMKIERS